MVGPYDLNAATIDVFIPQSSPGNYALGSWDGDKFTVTYVGRSDDNLNARLKQHIDEFPYFKFSHALSAKTAFEKECHNFHDFNPPGNKNHPARPTGGDLKCPRCHALD
jgi:hypothetical protein